MARIRTIKPEFWTDEKIVQLPFSARLVFIGLWNFADDDGRIRDEPDRLRMQIMPGDPVDMELALDVLVAAELIERWYGDDGSVILVVPGFGRHQLISHKSKSKLPLEAYRKAAIPVAARRQVAQKYGCTPGNENHPADCYFCGAPGSIFWPKRSDGKPSYWVAFSCLELDHFTPEHSGGATDGKNLVLSCRSCNRSRGNGDPHDFFPKGSGGFPNPPPGREGNGTEGKGKGEGKKDSWPGKASEPHPARVVQTAEPEAVAQPAPAPAPPVANEAGPCLAEGWNSRENIARIEARIRRDMVGNGPLDPKASPIAKLVAEGFDLENEVVPTILDIELGSSKPIRSWEIYAARARERINFQRKLAKQPDAPAPDAIDPNVAKVTLGHLGEFAEPVLATYVAEWRKDPTCWFPFLGPKPGEPGCLIPNRMLIGEAA